MNLVRNRDQAWNVGSFLLGGRSGASPLAQPASLPLLTARDARINFKLGNDKQVFALLASRVRVEPQPDGGWRLDVRATPLRTDRRLSEIGALTLNGSVTRAADTPGRAAFHLNLGLERGSVAQLWTFISGHEPPFRGTAAVNARIEGTREDWRAKGTLMLADLRRWDLVSSPTAPAWITDFQVRVWAEDSSVLLESVELRGGQSELRLTGSVNGLFRQPAWDLEARSDRLLLEDLAGQLAAFQESVPAGVRLQGESRLRLLLHGPPQGWEGEWTVPEGARLEVPEFAPVEISPIALRLARGRLELAPLTLSYSPDFALVMSGETNIATSPFPYRLHWQSDAVRLDYLRRTAAAFGWSLFGPARWRGRGQMALEWRGQLAGEEPARWQGDISLTDATYQPPELNFPLEIPEARFSWKGPRFEVRPLKLRVGEDEISLSLEHQERSTRWLLNGEAPRLQLDALDNLINPARQGLISRLVRPTQRREPAWRDIDLAGTIKIGEVIAGPFRLSQFEGKGEWQGGWLELSQLRFRAHGGRFDGRLQADFRGDSPHYRLAGNFKQVVLADLLAANSRLGEMYSGLLGADVALETSGTRARELLQSLRGRVVGVLQSGLIHHISLVDAMAAAAGKDRKSVV